MESLDEYRKRIRKIYRNAFWNGVRSVFFPTFDMPKIDLTDEGARKTDAEAIRGYWDAIGSYFKATGDHIRAVLPPELRDYSPDPHDIRYETAVDGRRNLRNDRIRVSKDIRKILDEFYGNGKKRGGSR